MSNKKKTKSNKTDAVSKIDAVSGPLQACDGTIIVTDPQGMYTGVPGSPYELNEKPVQDADDL